MLYSTVVGATKCVMKKNVMEPCVKLIWLEVPFSFNRNVTLHTRLKSSLLWWRHTFFSPFGWRQIFFVFNLLVLIQISRVNLFNAKHMYTCDFFPKKMFNFMGFFHWYGFGMVQGLNSCIYFSQKCAREAHFWLKQMHKFCLGTTFLSIRGCQVFKWRISCIECCQHVFFGEYLQNHVYFQ